MKYYYYIFILLSFSCIKKSSQVTDGDIDILNFTREDFFNRIYLENPERIDLPEAINPSTFLLVQDSLIIVQNREDPRPLKCGIYSLNSKKLIKEFATKGQGPKEVINSTLITTSNYDNIFYLNDKIKKRYWVYNIDSLFMNEDYIPFSFSYPADLLNLLWVGENEYIGYNLWYHSNPKFNSSKIEAIKKYSTQKEYETQKADKKYFVANATGGLIIYNKYQETYWVVNYFEDRIDIYSEELKLIQQLIGPDSYKPNYDIVKANGMLMLKFNYDEMYIAYTPSYITTPNHIYLLYAGINKLSYKDLPKPAEVFKFDWQGNLICNYILDEYINTISVDSEEKYIYGTSYKNSFSDLPELVRWEIKH